MMKHDRPRGKKWRWFLAMNLGVFVFLGMAFGREYVGHLQVEHEIARLQAEYTDVVDSQLETVSLLSQLASPYYLEGEARVKQGLGKDGETLLVIETPQVTTSSASASEERVISNPINWFYYFFDASGAMRQSL